MAPFPFPTHQTGRADLPHPAFRQSHVKLTATGASVQRPPQGSRPKARAGLLPTGL
jgi:hypothetical protein